MENAIQIAIGASISGIDGIELWLHDDGLKFSEHMTNEDFELAIAVLRDAADALETKLSQKTAATH